MLKLKRNEMQKLDLGRIMEIAKLKTATVGAQLFPTNQDPKAAVRRVIKGDAFLNSEQIAKLSEMLGVPIGLLFSDAAWSMTKPSDSKKRVIQFRSYEYFAELDLDTMTTTVSRNGLLFFEKITHPKGVEITEYLNDLTDLIIKYK